LPQAFPSFSKNSFGGFGDIKGMRGEKSFFSRFQISSPLRAADPASSLPSSLAAAKLSHPAFFTRQNISTYSDYQEELLPEFTDEIMRARRTRRRIGFESSKRFPTSAITA
jgi:hypothetical protein